MYECESDQVGLKGIQPAPENFVQELLSDTPIVSIQKRGYALVPLNAMPGLLSHLPPFHTAMGAFFSLPDAEKAAFAAGSNRVDSFGLSRVDGLKEYFQVRMAGPALSSPLQFPGPHTPSACDFGIEALHCFHAIDLWLRELLAEMVQCGLVSAEVSAMLDPLASTEVPPQICRSGGSVCSASLPSGYISSSNMDAFKYLNLKENFERFKSNHPSHTDSGILSLIPVSAVPGLEILDQELNQWIAMESALTAHCRDTATHCPDSLPTPWAITFPGDTLESLSAGRLPALMHRVALPSTHAHGSKERYSVVFKMRGRPEVTGPRYQVDYVVANIQHAALEALTEEERSKLTTTLHT